MTGFCINCNKADACTKAFGMMSGYYGGWIEWLVTLATDAFIAFPYYSIHGAAC